MLVLLAAGDTRGLCAVALILLSTAWLLPYGIAQENPAFARVLKEHSIHALPCLSACASVFCSEWTTMATKSHSLAYRLSLYTDRFPSHHPWPHLRLTFFCVRILLDDYTFLPQLYLLVCIFHEFEVTARQFSYALRLAPLNGLGRNQFRAHADSDGS